MSLVNFPRGRRVTGADVAALDETFVPYLNGHPAIMFKAQTPYGSPANLPGGGDDELLLTWCWLCDNAPVECTDDLGLCPSCKTELQAPPSPSGV